MDAAAIPPASSAHSANAGSASAAAAPQGNGPAQATTYAPRGDDVAAREDTGNPAGAFDLLMASGSVAAKPAAGTSAKTDSEAECPAQDATGPTDQLMLLLAQVAPGLAVPAQPAAATAVADAGGTAAIDAAAQLAQAMATTPPAPQLPDANAAAQAADAGSALPAALASRASASDAEPLKTGMPAGATATIATAIADAAPSAPAIDATAPMPAALPPAQAAPANAVPAAPAPALAPAPPVPQPSDPASGYDDSFGTQVSWLAEQRIGEAQIRISPEHLGAIDIRLQLDGDQVRAEFQSAHAEVRQTLEASLPRLRELLGQHGLQLAHAGVGQGRRQPEGGASSAQASGTTSRNEGGDALPPPSLRRARGLLDVYA